MNGESFFIKADASAKIPSLGGLDEAVHLLNQSRTSVLFMDSVTWLLLWIVTCAEARGGACCPLRWGPVVSKRPAIAPADPPLGRWPPSGESRGHRGLSGSMRGTHPVTLPLPPLRVPGLGGLAMVEPGCRCASPPQVCRSESGTPESPPQPLPPGGSTDLCVSARR